MPGDTPIDARDAQPTNESRPELRVDIASDHAVMSEVETGARIETDTLVNLGDMQ